MKSRYDYMRESWCAKDIDGESYPDPLSIDYKSVVDNTSNIPNTYTLTEPDVLKLWKSYYKATGKVEMDDVLYTLNGIEHVGVLEPLDQIYLFPTENVRQYKFKDLTNPTN